MTLGEHLRELRNRLGIAVLAVVLFGIIGFIFRNQIIEFMTDSMYEAAARTGAEATRATYTSPTDPLLVPMRVAFLTGLVLGAPVWIYQIWAFVTPAMYRNERRWAATVIGAAVPMFLAGVGVAIWIMPRAWEFLLTFTPTDLIDNLIPFSEYLNFFIRLVLVFGIGFLLPIFVVLLNAIGVLRHESLATARRWVIVGIFVFGAVATPTGDPLTLMVLATPMWLLFESAVLVCRIMDKRRDVAAGAELGDDEATPDEVLDTLGSTDEDSR